MVFETSSRSHFIHILYGLKHLDLDVTNLCAFECGMALGVNLSAMHHVCNKNVPFNAGSMRKIVFL